MSAGEKLLAFADFMIASENEIHPALYHRGWNYLRARLRERMPLHGFTLPAGEDFDDISLAKFAIKIGAERLAFSRFKGIGPIVAREMLEQAESLIAAKGEQ